MGEAFMLAVSAGPVCFLSCALVAFPLFLSMDINAKGNIKYGILFLAGRLAGYLVFACVLWIAGMGILPFLESSAGRIIHCLIYFFLGILMILSGVIYNFPKLKLCRIMPVNEKTREKAALFGLITGLNLCPPFLAASVRVLDHPGLLWGLMFFFVFFLATSLFFLPFFGVFWIQKKIESIKAVSRMALLLIGAYFLIFRGLLPLLGLIFKQGEI